MSVVHRYVDQSVAHPAHLNARDTTLVFVSRAPQADIERMKTRMGWQHIPWFTLTDDFDADFDVAVSDIRLTELARRLRGHRQGIRRVVGAGRTRRGRVRRADHGAD